MTDSPLIGPWGAVQQYVLGHGQVAISAAQVPHDDGSRVHILMIEPDLGTGTVGEPVPGREVGTVTYPAVGSTVLVFLKASSVEVVIDQLLEIRKAFQADDPPPPAGPEGSDRDDDTATLAPAGGRG